MADPLDYYHARATPSADARAAGADPIALGSLRDALGGRGEAVAVPAEFDERLDVTGDVATTAAIEAALRYADLGVFRGRDASARGGAIELHVRRAEVDAAREVARQVIARRDRLRGGSAN